MTDLAILMGLIFMAVCVVFVALHSIHLGKTTLIDWALIFMAGVYGGGWPVVAYVTEQGANPTWSTWLLPFKSNYPIHTLSSLLLAGSMLFGWLMTNPLVNKRTHRYLQSSKFIQTRLSLLMWMLLFIAFLSQWFYSRAYGGLLGVLEYSSFIRSATFDDVPINH